MSEATSAPIKGRIGKILGKRKEREEEVEIVKSPVPVSTPPKPTTVTQTKEIPPELLEEESEEEEVEPPPKKPPKNEKSFTSSISEKLFSKEMLKDFGTKAFWFTGAIILLVFKNMLQANYIQRIKPNQENPNPPNSNLVSQQPSNSSDGSTKTLNHNFSAFMKK
jgi:hypothetical protein